MAGPAPGSEATRSLRSLLELEEIQDDLYRANYVFVDRRPLYGGQVAAQALRAAAHTVEADRFPHSLHGYYLRPGDSSVPTSFDVHRDRDGRSFSVRRVDARQQGKVIFNMWASFHVDTDGPDIQEQTTPAACPSPDESRPIELARTFGVEARDTVPPEDQTEWPMRFWTRCTEDLGEDRHVQACALTYVSDGSSGLAQYADSNHVPTSSVDHAVWFHRPARADEWLLNVMDPHTVAGGRGWYTGSLYDSSGRLVASLAQEQLFHRRG